MGFDYINPHAEIPLFKAAWETVKELGNKAMSFSSSIVSGIAQVTDSALAGVGNMASSITDSLPSLSKESAPSMEVARVREPEIAAPVQQNHVDMAELGCFSAPTFGTCSSGPGIGR